MMDKPLLDDKNQQPTEAIIFPLIGRSKAGWRALFDHLGDAHPDFESTWRFYKDGGRWLLKTTRKSKTIFWLSVMPKHFVVTFYFGDKAEPAILESALSDPLKDAFCNGKRYGKVRGLSIEVRKKSDVADILTLIGIRLRVR